MTASINIRRTNDLADAPALAEIGARTFSQTFGHLYSDENLAAFLRDSHSQEGAAEILGDPDYAVWLCKTADGRDVGYCICGPTYLPIDNQPDNAGELVRLYVETDYQGTGLGKQMLELALAWMEEKFDHIYLSVYAENYGAQRLYMRYGFEKVQSYHFMVGDHADPEFIFKRRK